MLQFDLPVQAGDVALAELVDWAVELEREALCVRDMAQNPVVHIARHGEQINDDELSRRGQLCGTCQ